MNHTYDINHRFYKSVAASTTDTFDFVPVDGDEILIVRGGCDSSSAVDTSVCIIWDAGGVDQQTIISSYRDVQIENIQLKFTGDGIKVLRVHLANDSLSSYHMGGWVQGEIIKV